METILYQGLPLDIKYVVNEVTEYVIKYMHFS